MAIWIYDKTFEGFLTLVFDCYQKKIFPDRILGYGNVQFSLFQPEYEVLTDEVRAKRVWDGLHKKVSSTNCQMIYYVFLSEIEDIELLLLRYIRKAFGSEESVELNFGDCDVLELLKIDRKVVREAERIRMFVRFQKTKDGIYYASFDPKYNVLPLVTKHFENRFPDQRWIIYDTRRNYGFYYDLKNTSEFKFAESFIDASTGKIDQSIMGTDEQLFQDMWKSYFKSICIKERINPKLHMQMLPKRFWKYLIEKQT
ncbi:DNA metabolism protein [Tenuifilaceae bacterium CYCD]|nr:DNA metabolism protein [Tenuifilaceae bacterium CYCD]